MPWVSAPSTSSGYVGHRLVGGALEREQADLRAVAVRDHELVLLGDRREVSHATLTFSRWFSTVIGWPRRNSALPPSATTTLMTSLDRNPFGALPIGPIRPDCDGESPRRQTALAIGR